MDTLTAQHSHGHLCSSARVALLLSHLLSYNSVLLCRDHACFTDEVRSSLTSKRKPCSYARRILPGLLHLTQQLLAHTWQDVRCCSGQGNNKHKSSISSWQNLQRSCERCFCSSRLHKPLTATVAEQAHFAKQGTPSYPMRPDYSCASMHSNEYLAYAAARLTQQWHALLIRLLVIFPVFPR